MRIGPQRPVNPEAITAPQGFRVEALITGLTFPSAISFGPGGELYLAESGGVAGQVIALPRVLRIDPDFSVNEIGRLDNPILGLVYRNGELLIGEDAPSPRVLRVTAEGEVQVVVDGLPGGGDYGLSGLSLDPSGALLFGLGTRTNSGVVGLDNVARGWVAQHPDWADVAAQDLDLAGVNYVTAQPHTGGSARATTGSFKPFGYRCEPGETVRGASRSGGAIYRIGVEGGEPERVAWGFRNPVGVGCDPDGRIFATEGGMEERGSRPIANAPDNLWQVQPGAFYGWPDYASGIPVTDQRFRLPGHPQPRRLLAKAPQSAGAPACTFPSRSGAARFDFSTREAFGYVGDAFVALAGAWSAPAFPPESGSPRGHRVVRVDPRTGQVSDFLVNRNGNPSSTGNTGGLERPYDVRFDPSGEVLYVVDMGELQLNRESGLEPYGGTGVVWRITKIRPTLLTDRAIGAARGAAVAEAEDAEEEPEEQEDQDEQGFAEVDGVTGAEEGAGGAESNVEVLGGEESLELDERVDDAAEPDGPGTVDEVAAEAGAAPDAEDAATVAEAVHVAPERSEAESAEEHASAAPSEHWEGTVPGLSASTSTVPPPPVEAPTEVEAATAAEEYAAEIEGEPHPGGASMESRDAAEPGDLRAPAHPDSPNEHAD